MVMRQRFCSAAVMGLAAAVLLALPGLVQAQVRILNGGYTRPGVYGGTTYNGYASMPYGQYGWGMGNYGNYNPSFNAYNPGAWGAGALPGFYNPNYGYQAGYAGNTGQFYNPGLFYDPGLYGAMYAPSVYSAQGFTGAPNYGTPPYYAAATHRGPGAAYAGDSGTSVRQSFYPPVNNNAQGLPVNSAAIQVTVLPDAEVWFNGVKTNQTGAVRQFQSPPLEPGSTYTYQVRARWTQNGEPRDQTRDLRVAPNGRAFLDFTVPAAEK